MFLIFVFSVQILSPKRGFPPIAVSPSVQLSYSETCYTLFLYIRNSKLCFRLAVLIFFFTSKAERFLICSYFLDRTVQYHREQCQTEYNKNTLFHFFHSFSFKQRTQAATGRCSTKNRFCNCAKTNQKIPAKEFNFSLKLQASSLQLY